MTLGAFFRFANNIYNDLTQTPIPPTICEKFKASEEPFPTDQLKATCEQATFFFHTLKLMEMSNYLDMPRGGIVTFSAKHVSEKGEISVHENKSELYGVFKERLKYEQNNHPNTVYTDVMVCKGGRCKAFKDQIFVGDLFSFLLKKY